MRGVVSALAVVLVGLLLLGGVKVVLGETKQVAGTKHDVATPGTEPCIYCHVPRTDGEEILWASDTSAGGAVSGMKVLCFSCHDGTVTWEGMYAFYPHKTMHVRESGVKGRDCDLCHDPHESPYGKFLKVQGAANFCQSCHTGSGANDHPYDVAARAAGVEPEDTTWDPDNGDFGGTRLFNSDGTGPGDYVKCLSCHATHGGVPDTAFNTMPLGASHDEFLPLCMNCHASNWGLD